MVDVTFGASQLWFADKCINITVDSWCKLYQKVHGIQKHYYYSLL